MTQQNSELTAVPLGVLSVGKYNDHYDLVRYGHIRDKIFISSREAVVSTDPSVTTADWACVNCEQTFDCLKVMSVYFITQLN